MAGGGISASCHFQPHQTTQLRPLWCITQVIFRNELFLSHQTLIYKEQLIKICNIPKQCHYIIYKLLVSYIAYGELGMSPHFTKTKTKGTLKS